MPREREDFTSLHPNGLSFVQRATGKKGRSVHRCKLNKARFITIHSPEYKTGMTTEEAQAAWAQYVRSFQPRRYPR